MIERTSNLGHKEHKRAWKKLKKDNYRRDVKRNSFPHRVVDVWNNLDEK